VVFCPCGLLSGVGIFSGLLSGGFLSGGLLSGIRGELRVIQMIFYVVGCSERMELSGACLARSDIA